MTTLALIAPLVVLLMAEYIGDFLLQSREMALTKSSDDKVLLRHVTIIFCTMVFFSIDFGLKVIPLALIYCFIHGVQDKVIWNGYKWWVKKRIIEIHEKVGKQANVSEEKKQEWIKAALRRFESDKEYAEDKAFYDTIGLDRLLHVVTLVVLYAIFFL